MHWKLHVQGIRKRGRQVKTHDEAVRRESMDYEVSENMAAKKVELKSRTNRANPKRWDKVLMVMMMSYSLMLEELFLHYLIFIPFHGFSEICLAICLLEPLVNVLFCSLPLSELYPINLDGLNAYGCVIQ